jgi:HD-GYP domain-containing protein (c-di-GMP phosphodiesterase class II)
VLERLARDAVLFTHGEISLAVLVEEDADMILKASYEREGESATQHHRKVEEWFLRRCAATGQTLVAKQDRVVYKTLLGHEPAYQGPVHILVAPVPGRTGTIGVLAVMRRKAQGSFSGQEVHVVEEMAAQAAMALEQAVLFAKMRTYASEVELSYDTTLKVLMAALDAKDAATEGHSERVAHLTVAVAKEMALPKERLVDIERGALLHDVGKIGVPDAVLQKPDALDEGEWEAMQKHPLLAGLMVSKVEFLEGALPILLYHHERYDGNGYPFGLEADAIPLEARIFTVVDSYDAMTSDRPYRKAMPSDVALREIRENAGIQFDPQVVEAFGRVLARMQPLGRKRVA